jgi:AraC-like DNA-binding protein
MVAGTSLECADLSALWSVATCRNLACVRVGVDGLRRRAAAGQSGDRSPHSKNCPHSKVQPYLRVDGETLGMRNKQNNSDFQIDFDSGGLMARRRTELLPDGTYLFEDELEVGGVVTTTIITCAAWLLELYELRTGDLFFISGQKHIRPKTKRFGVFYPPFSITQPTFNNLKGRLLGIAASASLPAEFETTPIIFEAASIRAPAGGDQVIEILTSGDNRQPIDLNPDASVLCLKAKRLIDQNHLACPSIARIAKRLGVSHAHLSRKFKTDFGMSPSDYFRKLRVADAPLRLARGEEIVNVSEDVGYNDLSRFYKQFRKTTNTSPGVCKTMLRPPRS